MRDSEGGSQEEEGPRPLTARIASPVRSGPSAGGGPREPTVRVERILARLDRRPSDGSRATCLEGKFPLPVGNLGSSSPATCVCWAGPGLDGWAHRVVLVCNSARHSTV